MTIRQERVGTGADRAPQPAAASAAPGRRRRSQPRRRRPQAAAKPTAEEVEKALGEASERDRQKFAGMTFEEFKASPAVYKEPFEGGKYIVNGDTPILGDKQLLEFFETKVKQAPTPPPSIRPPVGPSRWPTWGGSTSPGTSRCRGSSSTASAGPGSGHATTRWCGTWPPRPRPGRGWRRSTSSTTSTQDGACGPTNASVVFDVRPVNAGGQYLARAFFPNEPRADRNVLIDGSSFELEPGEQAAARRHPAPRARAHARLPPRAHAAELGAVLRGRRVAGAHDVRPVLGHALPAVQRPGRLEPDPHAARPERGGVPLRAGRRGSRSTPTLVTVDLVPDPRRGPAHRGREAEGLQRAVGGARRPEGRTGRSPSCPARSSRRR